MSNDIGNLTALYRVVGKIEGMLSQFLGVQQEQSKRIGDAEERIASNENRLTDHDTRINSLETGRATQIGYLAGAGAVITTVVLVLAWALDKFWLTKGLQ